MTGRITRPQPQNIVSATIVHAWDRLCQAGYNTTLYNYRLSGKHPQRLLATPHPTQDGDAARGATMLGGRMSYGDVTMILADHPKPWNDSTDPGFLYWLHSFDWLEDLHAVADDTASRAEQKSELSKAIMRRWLDDHKRWSDIAWAPEVIAARIINWMRHAPLVLMSKDLVYRSSVLNHIARSSRHLMRSVMKTPEGLPRLMAISGLVHAGLYLPYGKPRLNKGMSLLNKELSNIILPDGGLVTRSPADTVMALKEMITLKQALEDQKIDVPKPLQHAIDRAGPMVMALRSGDGTLVHFYNSLPKSKHFIDSALASIDDTVQPIENAGHVGFQRISANDTLLVMDSGPPPIKNNSYAAHASTLSIEVCDGADPIIVNCGQVPDSGANTQDIHEMMRTTGAHSTLSVGDRNSSVIKPAGFIGAGVHQVRIDRDENDDGIWINADHDGYIRLFGLVTARRLYVSMDGRDIRGEDKLTGPLRISRHSKNLEYQLRFHLHPSVQATYEDANKVVLKTASTQLWNFQMRGGKLSLDESLFIDDNGDIHPTHMIQISGPVDPQETAVQWSLRKQVSQTSATDSEDS